MIYWQMIKKAVAWIGAGAALLLAFIFGSTLQKNKHNQAKIKDQEAQIKRDQARQEEWKKIDEQASKKNATLTTATVVDELNHMFAPTDPDDIA